MRDMPQDDLAYLEGFMKACSDKGLDPETLLKQAVTYDDRRRRMNIMAGTAGGALEGAMIGNLVGEHKKLPALGTIVGTVAGGALGAGTGVLANLIRKYMQEAEVI